MDAVLRAAMAVFLEAGVDAPARTIAERAGVGIGTLYRHFPQRSDLIKAIIEEDVAAQREAATTLAAKYPPGQALALWMHRLIAFVGAKRGLGPVLHSSEQDFQALPNFVLGELTPPLRSLLDAAARAGSIRDSVDAEDLLSAGMRLATPAVDGSLVQARRMVAMLIDGLAYRPRGSTV